MNETASSNNERFVESRLRQGEPIPDVAHSPEKRAGNRLTSIDIVRGLVMVIMALDHVRDYFLVAPFNTMDPARSTLPLFFTRWITHFCAPAFFLLAGIGIYLSQSRGKSPWQIAQFLFSRGLFLVILDLTVIRVGWDFNFSFFRETPCIPWFIVLSMLGFSMIILAAFVLLRVPIPVIAALSILLIAGHNMLDDDEIPNMLGDIGSAWPFFHIRSYGELEGFGFYISYPLIPWVGVMTLGYVLGPIMKMESRQRWLALLGSAMLVGFVVLRTLNVYGDPRPRLMIYQGFDVVLDFVRTKKYPPSLIFLLMTLGTTTLLLALCDQRNGFLARILITFGRVPLFYYVLHLYLLHALAVGIGLYLGYPLDDLCVSYGDLPKDWHFKLPVVYLIWAVVVIALYPCCAWYGDLKKRSKNVLLSYL